MASKPLLPLDHKGLTRAQTADLFRGLADWLELYPGDAFVVSAAVEEAITEGATKTRKPRNAKTHTV